MFVAKTKRRIKKKKNKKNQCPVYTGLYKSPGGERVFIAHNDRTIITAYNEEAWWGVPVKYITYSDGNIVDILRWRSINRRRRRRPAGPSDEP